jgi:hypothetical protein
MMEEPLDSHTLKSNKEILLSMISKKDKFPHGIRINLENLSILLEVITSVELELYYTLKNIWEALILPILKMQMEKLSPPETPTFLSLVTKNQPSPSQKEMVFI